MALNFIVLFVGTFLGGMLIYWVRFKSEDLRLPLIFAGAFIFSITVIHILPELFSVSENPMWVGWCLCFDWVFLLAISRNLYPGCRTRTFSQGPHLPVRSHNFDVGFDSSLSFGGFSPDP